jgi:peroxiredoxin Q/BCP
MPLQSLKVSGTLYSEVAMKADKKTVFKNHVTRLKAGDSAPDFCLPDESGKIHCLKDYKGSKLVLYFYPADATPTCTEEACNLRDNFDALSQKGLKILGVSKDDIRSHQKFIAKHKLPFSLLADTELKMIRDYDVWGAKQFMGKLFDGIARTTFLISETGKIERVITKVKSKMHAAQLSDPVL